MFNQYSSHELYMNDIFYCNTEKEVIVEKVSMTNFFLHFLETQ